MKKLALIITVASLASTAATASADTIAGWDFNNYTSGNVVTAPVANSGNAANNGIATGLSLNMTNSYTYANGEGPGAVDGSNITTTTGITDNQWRIVGNSNTKNSGAGQANGWNTSAPQYTQGASFAFDSTGYANLTLNFGWETTTQGVADLMVRESSNGGSTWTNVLTTPLEQTTAQGTINVGAANYNISLAAGTNDVELVSAYNPTLGNYASATSAASGSPVAYNNNSGNWRFNDVSITGVAVPEPSAWALAAIAAGLVVALRCRVACRL